MEQACGTALCQAKDFFKFLFKAKISLIGLSCCSHFWKHDNYKASPLIQHEIKHCSYSDFCFKMSFKTMTDEPLLIFYSLSHYSLHQPIHHTLTNMHTEARSPGTAPSGHPIPLLLLFFCLERYHNSVHDGKGSREQSGSLNGTHPLPHASVRTKNLRDC